MRLSCRLQTRSDRMADKSQPPTAEDIKQFVEDKDDFALELFAYRELLQHGWSARHGGAYIDPVTDKFRQFDLQAHKDWTPLRARIRMAAECKNIDPIVPMIVSRVPRSAEDAFHCLISSGTNDLQVQTSTAADAKPYHVDAPVGKSVNQYQQKKNSQNQAGDDPYWKWAQALASCATLATTAAHDAVRGLAPSLQFVMPVLIVADHALWVVDYDSEGVPRKPQAATEATLFVDRIYEVHGQFNKLKYRVSHLHICTKAGFVQMLNELDKPTSQTMERIFRFGFLRLP